MVAEAPALGSGLTVGADPRITRAGAWLRRTRVDELPQLIDVLAGRMSLVGPRPEVPAYVGAVPERAARAGAGGAPRHHRPGVAGYTSTSAAQLARAADPEREYVEVILPRKLQCAARLRTACRPALATCACCARTLRLLWARGRRVSARRAAPDRLAPAGPAAGPAAAVPRTAVAGRRRAGHRRLLEHHLPVPPRLRALDLGAAGYDVWVMCGVVAAYLVAFTALSGAAEHVALFRLRRDQAADAGLRAGRRRQRPRW